MSTTKEFEYILKVKNMLSEELLGYSKRQNNIASITIVGSHSDKNKPVEKLNDYDIIFVFEKLNKASWDSLMQFLNEFSSRYQNEWLGIVVETKIGPFKSQSPKTYTLQIHCAIYDAEMYQGYIKISPLVAYDWQRSQTLYGKSLKEIAPVEIITSEDVISTRCGINFYIDQIKNSENIIIQPFFNADGKYVREIVRIPQNNEQRAELCFKSIKYILIYLYKLRNEMNSKPSDTEILDSANKLLSEEQSNDLNKIQDIYKNARDGKEIAEEEIRIAQEKATRILEALRSNLND